MVVPQTAPSILAADNTVTLVFCLIAIPFLLRLLLAVRMKKKQRLVISSFSGPLTIYLLNHLLGCTLLIPDVLDILLSLAGVNFSAVFNNFWFSYLCFFQLDSLTLVSVTACFLTGERVAAILFKQHYCDRHRRAITALELLLIVCVFAWNAGMTLFLPDSPTRYELMMIIKFSFALGNLLCSFVFLAQLHREKLNINNKIVLTAVCIGFFLDILPTTLTYLNSLYFLLFNVELSSSIGNLIIPGYSIDAALCGFMYTRALFRKPNERGGPATVTLVSNIQNQLPKVG